MGVDQFLVEPELDSVVTAKLQPRGLFVVAVNPGAGVSHALLAAEGLEQIHQPGALGAGAAGQGLPVYALRLARFRGKGDVEQSGVVLAGLAVRPGHLPSGDEAEAGLDLLQGGFRRLACRPDRPDRSVARLPAWPGFREW